MKPLKFIAPIAVATASLFILTACNPLQIFDTGEKKEFRKFTPEITRNYSTISWDEVKNASSYDVYKNGELVENITSNVYNVGTEIEADCTYYITAHSDEFKRDTKKSNEVIYYKNTNFTESETVTVSSSSSVTVSNNVRNIVLDHYTSGVSLTIADRTADLVVTLKSCSISSGLDFTVSSDKTAYTAVIVLDGDSSISGTNGKSYTAADKGATNSEIDGKPGGNGQTALKASELVIKGNGNLTLTGGNGGNASEGADSSGTFSKKFCGKGASGGNGGNGLSCTKLTLDIGSGNKVRATGGSGGKKSKPGVNGALISGPIVSAAWFNWDIGKDGTSGVGASVSTRDIISGDII